MTTERPRRPRNDIMSGSDTTRQIERRLAERRAAARFETPPESQDIPAVEAILDRHGRSSAQVIAILQDIQEKRRYLPETMLARLRVLYEKYSVVTSNLIHADPECLSPHTYAENFKTPTLVTHGELDFRVPIGEGLQLFTTLQRLGVPSKRARKLGCAASPSLPSRPPPPGAPPTAPSRRGGR